ncbi:uncharacterized [Tachysurus ichikawai]
MGHCSSCCYCGCVEVTNYPVPGELWNPTVLSSAISRLLMPSPHSRRVIIQAAASHINTQASDRKHCINI